MLLLLSSYGEPSSVTPAFAVNFEQAHIKVDDVGFHLLAADLSWNISGTSVPRFNLLAADNGWKIKTASRRWNIKKGE